MQDRRWLALAAVLLATSPPARAEPPRAAPAAERPLRILVQNHLTRRALHVAARGAAARLERPECARVLTEFDDAAGRPLDARLEELGQTAAGWMSQVIFADAALSGFCRPHVVAFTEPGSRVIRICPDFGLAQRRRPRLAEVVLIHELLHTLGLGENPPTSREITRRVVERCGAPAVAPRTATAPAQASPPAPGTSSG